MKYFGAIPIILLIIFIIAICTMFMLKRQEKKRVIKAFQDIATHSPYKQNLPPPLKKSDQDYLARDQEIEQEKERTDLVEVTKYNEVSKNEVEETKIVGVVEAKGFWSKFVISQKLGFLVARMNSQDKGKGFWVNLINAQSMSQGKDQGKGR